MEIHFRVAVRVDIFRSRGKTVECGITRLQRLNKGRRCTANEDVLGVSEGAPEGDVRSVSEGASEGNGLDEKRAIG